MTPGLTPGSTPTTPGSQTDPFDDQLWFQFLNDLNSDGNSDFNKILEDADADDANDDPDFILAGDNCVEELLDPDDERIQVPKSETVALVKDTFEFCGTAVPIGIASDEPRIHKSKSGLTSILRRNTNESFDTDLLDSSIFGQTSKSSSGAKRLRFNESSTAAANNDLERSLFASAAAAGGLDPNASDLFDYFNPPSTAHAVITTYSSTTSATSTEATMPSTSAASFLNNQAPKSSSSNTEAQNDHHISTSTTTEGSSRCSGAKSSTAEAKALEKSAQRSSTEADSGEFIPEFTDQQRRQLDEQLRNHVQLLTQTCLANYPIDENKQIFNNAFGLLKIFDQLSNNGWEDEQPDGQDGKDDKASTSSAAQKKSDQSSRFVLSPDFKIVSLNESLDIVNKLATMDKTELASIDSRNGIPAKFLETIVNSPVFYNTNLIPKCRYNYQSQYKRSHFFDSEKILLIMGYNKFKHLSKKECCQCIKDHLLPHRSTLDIKKQLNNISNSEQRQLQLKELMDRQKEQSEQLNRDYEFSVEVNYKSPLEQSNRVQLPSMYTLEIERSKMSHLLKDAREKLGILPYKAAAKKKDLKKPKKAISRSLQLVEITDENQGEAPRDENSSDESAVEELPVQDKALEVASNVYLDDTRVTTESENEQDMTITFSKTFKRASSPTSTSPSSRKKFGVLNSTFLNETPSHHSTVPCNTPVTSSTRARSSKINKMKTTTAPSASSSRISSQLLNQSIILPSTFQASGNAAQPILISDSASPFNIGSLMRNICVDSTGSRLVQAAQQRQPSLRTSNQMITPVTSYNQHQQQQPPQMMIPPNFAGTVLYQPTIHIHMSARSSQENLLSELKKFRQIVPKSNQPPPPATKQPPASKRSKK